MTETIQFSGVSRLQLWLRRLLLLGPILYFLAAAYIILRRCGYPFELEWMEGGTLIQVLRLLEGKPLYVPPSLSYIPFIYPPFYYYVSAFAARISGNDWFLPLRLVSVVATLGTLFLIYRIVLKTTGSQYWGVIAAGLFVASFRLGGAWFDIARVDMLYILLLTAGSYLLLVDSRGSYLWAGLLFALAFYTKQTALPQALTVFIYLLLTRRWRSAFQFGVVFSSITLLILIAEDGFSNSWYSYYILYLPSLHRIPQPVLLALFANAATLLGALAIAVVLAALPFLIAPLKLWNQKPGMLGVITLSALIVSVTGNAQPGGYENANLPALASIPILSGLGGYWLETHLPERNRETILSVLFLLLAGQFLMLHYNVVAQIPTTADREAGNEIISRLESTQGDVLVPFHGYLALKAGKSPTAHQVMLWLISGRFGQADRLTWSRLSREIDDSLNGQRYQRILLDRPDEIWDDVSLYYNAAAIEYSNIKTFIPVTGGRTRPNLDYLPKQP